MTMSDPLGLTVTVEDIDATLTVEEITAAADIFFHLTEH